jgi:tungstate transport system substrate-binding protein
MKSIKRMAIGCGLILLAMAMIAPAMAAGGKTLLMATTTSTDNTHLLDYLAPEFQKATGIELKWTAKGTGIALKLGENCDVDVLLVHAPPAEKKYVAAGFGIERREVMYNDFVIIGPPKDPAGIKGKSVVEALKAVAAKGAAFVSRGDNSGTNKKELLLWKESGLKISEKEKESWYVQTGQGMMSSIIIASQKDGYILTDRGTFITYANDHNDKPPLVVLVEGDPGLFNQYSVMLVNPARCKNAKSDLARKFSDWICSAAGQKLIADFKLKGKSLFIPNAK